jgi:hypothetical protein
MPIWIGALMVLQPKLGAVEMRNLGEVDDLPVSQSEETGNEDLGLPPVSEFRVNLEIHSNPVALRGDDLERMKYQGARLLLQLFEMPDVRLYAPALQLLISDHFRIWRKVPFYVSAIELLPIGIQYPICPLIRALQSFNVLLFGRHAVLLNQENVVSESLSLVRGDLGGIDHPDLECPGYWSRIGPLLGGGI